MSDGSGAHRVAVVAKNGSPQAAEAASELLAWLERRGVEALADEATARAAGRGEVPRFAEGTACDLIVVLGGDGTLLAVARRAAGGPPILGVNLGRLGFLTEVPREGLYPALVEVLAGRYTLEARALFDVEVRPREGERRCYRALNDVVIAKSALSRIIELQLDVDGGPVSRYRSDGLVLSTPTGSTAYNLSAGGPILHPLLPVAVITPICPHTLTLRPLVVPDTSLIEVTLESRDGGAAMTPDRIHLTVDGQEGGELDFGDCVRVTRAAEVAKLVRTSSRMTIFEGLRNKLHWGE